MNGLNTAGKRFASSIAKVEQLQYQKAQQYDVLEKMHITGTGRVITGAYEQLRNAAENTDDKLFMQRAIRRFFKRSFFNDSQADISQSGEELITELTLAGYIANDSIAIETIDDINSRAGDYFSAYQKLNRIDASDRNERWTIDVLSIETTILLLGQKGDDEFIQFAFEVFLKTIDWSKTFKGDVPDDYELLLYISLHRTLMKSEDSAIRYYLLRRFQRRPDDYANFVSSNRQIDELIERPAINMVSRLINRRSAGLRVMVEMLHSDNSVSRVIDNRPQFLLEFESQVDAAYSVIESKIRRGVTKSIVFLIITKFLIGLAVEVPYDFFAYQQVVWLPLIINFLAPIVYIASVGFTLEVPSSQNTKALVRQIDGLLYGDIDNAVLISPYRQKNQTTFSVIYGLLFIIVFGLVSWGLVMLGFDWLHILIFFLFFSAASFLGFRLTRIVRELEAVDGDQSVVANLRDFIYMPFIVVGQKLNEQYSRINIVASFLDMVIEMPLKSILRFIRQWSSFMSSKKDEL